MKPFLVSLFLLASFHVPSRTSELVFAVEEGSRSTKTFESSFDLEKKSMKMSVGGQELPDELTESFVMTISHSQKVVVADEYGAAAEGRPVTLVRTYRELEKKEKEVQGGLGSEPETVDEDETSALAGRSVRFTWNEEESEYDAQLVGEPADDELLEDLEEDMDLRVFLPGKAVEEGDAWEFDPKLALGALPPGGRLGFTKDEDDGDFDFEEVFEGTGKATFKGTRTTDGRKLGVIAIAIEGRGEEEADEAAGTPAFVLELDFEGELLWDIEARHAHAIEGGADLVARISLTQAIEGEGTTHELEMEAVLEGKMKLSGSFGD